MLASNTRSGAQGKERRFQRRMMKVYERRISNLDQLWSSVSIKQKRPVPLDGLSALAPNRRVSGKPVIEPLLKEEARGGEEVRHNALSTRRVSNRHQHYISVRWNCL